LELFTQIVFWIFIGATLIQLIYYWAMFSPLAFYKKPDTNSSDKPPVSVVISARNEYHNLKDNLEHILNQDYPEFEVIVVNHASTDESRYFLEELKNKYHNLKVVQIDQDLNFFKGKKFPLSIGIKSARHDLLLLTDADCIPSSKNWISKMASAYKDDDTGIVLGYGPYLKQKGLLNLLIRYDTFMVAVQYLSYALAGLPYMGVGRNLSYRKSLFIKNKGFISHYNIPSGDDDLFINRVATKTNCSIEICPDSFMSSKPKTNFKEWYNQKTRHLSAGRLYKTKFKILLGTFGLSQIILYCSFLILVAMNIFPLIVLPVFGIRLISQLIVNKMISQKLDEAGLYLLSPILEILLLVLLSIFSLTGMRKKVSWK
jgi:cellulose synthase/poly-beta-1,6-N-acetylglucosamine synthase-like glycosyltransferase